MKLVQFSFDASIGGYQFAAGQVVMVDDDTDLTGWPVEVVSSAPVFVVISPQDQDEPT